MAGAKKLLLLGCGTALALAAVLYGAVFGFTDTFVALFNSENSAFMAEYAHSEQVTMAATPRLTEVMVASVGRLTAPR